MQKKAGRPHVDKQMHAGEDMAEPALNKVVLQME